MLEANNGCQDEILRGGELILHQCCTRSCVASAVGIALMFFENVSVGFFDATLFRRLQGNFLKENENVREQTTFKFGLLSGRVR